MILFFIYKIVSKLSESKDCDSKKIRLYYPLRFSSFAVGISSMYP